MWNLELLNLTRVCGGLIVRALFLGRMGISACYGYCDELYSLVAG